MCKNGKKEKMDKIEQAKMSAKETFEEVKPTYQASLNDNFDLD